MAKIEWDAVGTKTYETGVDRGVLYPKDAKGIYPLGVAWNGLTKISESPDGATVTKKYANNNEYASMVSKEEFKGSIEAFTNPDEWYACDGSAEVTDGVLVSQQDRQGFGLSYRTLIGNDTEGTAYGYKLHLVYNGLATPSKRDSSTVNDSPDATALSWDFTTTPVNITAVNPLTKKEFKPSSHIIIDSTKVDEAKLTALEAVLYGGGSDATAPRMPLPDEVFTLLGYTAA